VPSKVVSELMQKFKELEQAFTVHIKESGAIQADLKWLKWINMGIAALVLFKLVADWIK
jgi:hypothetical protein